MGHKDTEVTEKSRPNTMARQYLRAYREIRSQAQSRVKDRDPYLMINIK
jgi:hypothetical protein